MIMRRLFVAMLLVMLCLAEGVVEAEGGAAQTEVVLTGDELERHPIEAGMLVEIVYGEGARHGFSGAWEKLVRVHGVVERVDWERRQLVVAQEEDEAKETVAVDRIQTMTVIGRAELVDSQTQGEPSDSLIAKEIAALERWPHAPFDDIENRRLRVLAKLGTGTVSCVVFTVLTMGALEEIWERTGDPDADAYRAIGFILTGSIVGCVVGFPIGVTSVDPYDSSLRTLLAGAIPGAMGLGVIRADQNREGTAALLMYVVPVISSLIVSEQSRKPPQSSQNSRVSFGLAPALNGGFSASATLRF